MTHMDSVGVRELRQNLSRYLVKDQGGREPRCHRVGREVARLMPSGPTDSPIARLVGERGATMPRGDLLDLVGAFDRPPAGPPFSDEILDELREERL